MLGKVQSLGHAMSSPPQYNYVPVGSGFISKFTQQSPSTLLPKHKSPLLRTLLIYLFFPVVFPIVIYRMIRQFRERFGLKQRPLEGKVVVLTGASSGIGEALAHRLYSSGCKLILTSRRIKELERVKSDLVLAETYGPVYIPATLTLDLENLESINKKSAEIHSIYGRVDILINNAGVSYRGDVLNTDIELDQKIMRINYFGPLALTKCIAKEMVKRQSGHILFIGSIQGKLALPFRSAYTASKHATQAVADCLRAELSSKGVRVTSILPGYVKTNLSYNALTESGRHGKLDPSTASGYTPDFVAERIVRALMKEEKEVTVATLTPRLAILIRNLYPPLFFRLMSSRADAES